MLASTGDGGGRNTRRRYILTCLLTTSSFLNYILDIYSRIHERGLHILHYMASMEIFNTEANRIQAHEEDQYTAMFRKYKADFFVYSTQTD